MSKFWEGFVAWINPQAVNPRYLIVELEKGLHVPNKDDDAAIASLRDHPGMVALLNRMKLKQAYLTSQLTSVRHKDIRDVDFLQSGLTWARIFESEIVAATERLSIKKAPVLAVNEVEEFERVRSAIESVRITSPE